MPAGRRGINMLLRAAAMLFRVKRCPAWWLHRSAMPRPGVPSPPDHPSRFTTAISPPPGQRQTGAASPLDPGRV
jgi:hypothetical protein